MTKILALLLSLVLLIGPVAPALAQSGGNCSVFRTWVTGDTVTAADLNSSFTTVGVTNGTLACVDGLSDSLGNMQSVTSPYVSGSESQASSAAGEIQRLRYVLQTITGWTNWYRVDQPMILANVSHITVLNAVHVNGAPITGTWGSKGNSSGTGGATNAGHVFTLRAHAVQLMDARTHTLTMRMNPAAIHVDISDVTGGTGGGATPNGADRKATFNANSWIHFYWIWHTGSSLLRGVASEKDPTVGPNLPSGFSAWSYAAPVRRGPQDATPLQGTHVSGSMVRHHAYLAVVTASTTAGAVTTVDLSSVVPPNAMEAELFSVFSTAGSAQAHIGTGFTAAGITAGNPQANVTIGANTESNWISYYLPNVSQRLLYYIGNDSGTANLWIYSRGSRMPNGGT